MQRVKQDIMQVPNSLYNTWSVGVTAEPKNYKGTDFE